MSQDFSSTDHAFYPMGGGEFQHKSHCSVQSQVTPTCGRQH